VIGDKKEAKRQYKDRRLALRGTVRGRSLGGEATASEIARGEMTGREMLGAKRTGRKWREEGQLEEELL
jgi:hypothetical protein